MGLLGLLFGWPLAPIKGVIRLGELIQEQVERQMSDPAAVRRELEEIERDAAEGLISEEEQEERMREVLARMIGPPAGTAPAGPGPAEGASDDGGSGEGGPDEGRR
ncbi:gas vesicle protein GvpG [Nonomuraea rhodomycinica]|uniref:Gas vesicle protein GvpG n=1 Tax=Nonomuraea rhodomycinica TaxID=1712872 RepID=A0A7Y6IRM0_9ACTN|nr:gas vesicle protein GvpG [Nonomuraea rhodomycinica]NUW43122.1 gas vesicle protein GvpG [Nonomuraea rhodomycinica]